MEKNTTPADQPRRNASFGGTSRAARSSGTSATNASTPRSAAGNASARAIPESRAGSRKRPRLMRLMQQDAQDLAGLHASRQRGPQCRDAERGEAARGLLLPPASRRAARRRQV